MKKLLGGMKSTAFAPSTRSQRSVAKNVIEIVHANSKTPQLKR